MTAQILVEAEEFDEYGGWTMDSQFELQMGSPYLLAHGNGKSVTDTMTVISVRESGEYNVWVRAKDWVPQYHPGRFTVTVNNAKLDKEFGANNLDWNWDFGGRVNLVRGPAKLTLHDLTGFCGRCDAIYFSQDDKPPPEGADNAARAWRRQLRGLPDTPVDGGRFDVIVVGGGVPGCAAVLTSARLGERVALIHDRPVLGGNASKEIGLRPRGLIGPVVEDLTEREPDGNLLAKQLLNDEQNVSIFLSHTVYNTVVADNAIVSVDAREARSGREVRFTAPLFIDCSGKAILGLLSGASTLSGQESREEYGESLAPAQKNNMHHGNTLFFRTRMADSAVSFPSVPWATVVSKDYSNLGGQLQEPGLDNGPGPVIVPPGPEVKRRMRMPLTHFWEYGQHLDSYKQAEHIRDHLLRAVYGTFSNVKTMDPKRYANLDFDHVAYVPAQGEFRRYRGEYILTENDIRQHTQFPDSVAMNGGAFCLHYPGDPKYDFRLKDWKWDERDGQPYDIPFRCLYSADMSNLMMAGKHISVTHVAGSNTKFMGNGAHHAIATAAAAHLCHKYKMRVRDIAEKHFVELRDISHAASGGSLPSKYSKL